MWIRRRLHHHRASRERLNFVADAAQQLAVSVDRLELGCGEFERQWQQEPLGGRAIAGELAHGPLVQHPFVRGVLVHDGDARVGLEHDVGIEDLKQRRAWTRGSGLGNPLETNRGAPERRPRSPQPRAPSPQLPAAPPPRGGPAPPARPAPPPSRRRTCRGSAPRASTGGRSRRWRHRQLEKRMSDGRSPGAMVER